jgi:glycosyltransferase involved in cell wall biosynthesis
MKGWLINDQLTAIAGTRTLWHNLLDWMDLRDMSGGYTPFRLLAERVENEPGPRPDFCVRNATYFRKINWDVPTMALLQDIQPYGSQLHDWQHDVGRDARVVVVNSEYMKWLYKDMPQDRVVINSLGIDFNHFKARDKAECRAKLGLPKSGPIIMFIGSKDGVKGYDRLVEGINRMPQYHFLLVMKHGTDLARPNVSVLANINHEKMVDAISSCDLGVCTSYYETQHLAGIEMGACGLPLVASRTGIYWGRPAGIWGRDSTTEGKEFVQDIEEELATHRDPAAVRQYWIDGGFDLDSCRLRWLSGVKLCMSLSAS